MFGSFFRKGSVLALTAILPGGQALAMVALAGLLHGASSGSRVGLVLQLAGLSTVAFVGVTILVVNRCGAKTSEWRVRLHELRLLARCASLISATVYAGFVAFLASLEELAGAGLVFAIASGVAVSCIPLLSWQAGVMQVLDLERLNLVWGVLIAIAPVVALIFLRGCAASVALGVAGSVWSLVVVASVLHREYAASRAGATIGRVPPGVAGLRGVVRDLISSLLGASDGLMMMVVFTVLLTLAHIAGDSEALGVAFAINVARIFVLPLKQFGMVGGRLVLQGAGAVSSYVGLMCAVLSIIAIALVACAMLDIHLSGVSPELFLLLALQMTIEPFGAFLSTMRKVIEGPSATVAGLAVCLVLVVAASCCLLYFGLFTAVNVWLVWVAGRIVFAVSTCVGLRSRELTAT